MYRIGTFGNAAALGQIATKFGVGEATVENFTWRVICAINDLSCTWIRWPDQIERKSIGLAMAHEILPKCIGFIDESAAIFYQAPLNDKETYWSRKKHYCMQFQIVCDSSRRIKALFACFPGSVHDAKLFASSPVYTKANDYFSDGEFLIGDSTYPKSQTIVVPYRRSGGHLDGRKGIFNKHISSKCMAVEHTIGILKGRFQSLCGLRLNVDKQQGHRNVCEWIKSCCVLHNFLIQRDPWIRKEHTIFMPEENEDDEGIEMIPINTNDDKASELKRSALCEIVNAMYK